MPTDLNLSDLRTDGGTQPRSEMDMGVVAEYAEAMKRGVDFPPLSAVYDGTDYWLYDGFHRLRAAKKVGRTTIGVEVQQGTRKDAQWHSLSANKDHGLRRSQADKRRAIKRALKMRGAGESDNQIAQHIGCSHATVGKYRKEMESTCQIDKSDEREGRDGRTIDTSNIGSGSSNDKTQSGDASNPGRDKTTSTQDPKPRGDGAPNRSHRSSRTTSDSSTSSPDPVTTAEVTERVCGSLQSIASEGSHLYAALTELTQFAEEGKLSEDEVERLQSSIQSTANRLLEFSDALK